MAPNPNKLSQFWQELKRRRVVHVTIVYATAAVVIIDLVNNVTSPLRLPEWTPTLVIVILAIGFPLAIIFSWIFDVTPEGIEKTRPAGKKSEAKSQTKSNGWKIASYISIAVIIGLVLINILGRGSSNRIDETLEKSIAILPVRNISGDPDQESMCSGLTIEIINQLYKIKSFDKVVPPQTVLKYRNSEKSNRQIAEELGVNYILDLSYRKVGPEFTVITFLVEPLEDRTLWQDDYHQRYEEIISMSSEIALKIAGKLQAFISGEEKKRIEKPSTSNLEAYELIQSVIYHFFQSPDPDFHLKESILKAIELDSTYADAYAVMALFSTFSSTGAGGQLGEFDVNDAFIYNPKALEIDPENIYALLVHAIIEQWINWNYVAAEAQFRKAFSLSPNTRDKYLIGSYIEFLIKMGRFEDALSYVGRLDQRDPREMLIYAALGQVEKAKELIPKYKQQDRLRDFNITLCYIWMEEYELARKFVESFVLTRVPDLESPKQMADWALILYKTGDQSASLDYVNRLKIISGTSSGGMAEYNLGRYYSGIGEIDTAFFWLEKAFDERCVDMSWLKVDPTLKNLRKDEHYLGLLDRTGHGAYDQYMAGRN